MEGRDELVRRIVEVEQLLGCLREPEGVDDFDLEGQGCGGESERERWE